MAFWSVVAKTGSFLAVAEKLLSEEELSELEAYLACNPEAGDVIPGTGGVRKYRIGVAGRGKRGGARVIFYYYDATMPLYLIALYAKNEKIDLTTAEKAAIRTWVKTLVQEHKKRRQAGQTRA